MSLPYPITSYASHHVDLTGGALDKFENFIIAKTTNVVSSVRTYNALKKLNERELMDIGLTRADILPVSKTALSGARAA
ncbi:DUF1127 domain-containing protein [Terasakiella sp.]|uniref:DUF1127 domain-containing protein n=1 Tax=Terasakiella sp. TaxID=2034861 RepID=UPI003AA8DA65